MHLSIIVARSCSISNIKFNFSLIPVTHLLVWVTAWNPRVLSLLIISKSINYKNRFSDRILIWITTVLWFSRIFNAKMVNHTIDFYHFPGSPPSRAALLLVMALGLKHNVKMVNLMEGEQLKPDFLKVSWIIEFLFDLIYFIRSCS